MKNFSTLVLAAFILPMFVNAQVIITDIQPEVGDQFIMRMTTSEMSTGQSGANAEWDFSTMGAMYMLDYTVTNPEEALGFESFPESTVAWVGTILDVGTIQGFLSFEDGTMYDHGSYAEDYFNILTTYNEPITRFRFPINALDLDTISTTYTGTTAVGDLYTLNYVGTREYVVDGYGSIITPLGSFPNAVRVAAIQVETTTGVMLIKDITYEYSWFVPEYPVPIMTISNTETWDMGEYEGVVFSNVYLYEYNVASGIAENDLPALNLFPNPAQNEITIQSDFRGQAVLNIYTVDGKKVDEYNIRNIETIDISALIPGFYIAEVRSDGSLYSRTRFVVSK